MIAKDRLSRTNRRNKVQRIAALLFAASLALVMLFPTTSVAQTRKRSTTKSSRTTSTAAPKTSEVQREGATRVADQIKKLTKFIYLLGGIAKGLEGFDDAAKRNEASAAIIEQTQKYKQQVRATIQSLRVELDQLEIDFRQTPELQRYYISLAGVAQGAATAEELAAANKFDQAGRSLLGVVNRLTDVLLGMR
jgi:cell division septum initiation protein DivIVA